MGIFIPPTLEEASRAHASQPYLVDGLLRPQSVNLLVGDSGLGKTPLAIQLGICVAAGLPFLGKPVKQGPVLYCDAESSLLSFWDTLRAISGFLGLPEPPRDFHVWSLNWELHVPPSEASAPLTMRLLNRVYLVEPTLVIVDPLRMFRPEAETKNEEAVSLISDLRKASKGTKSRPAWLISHHRRKVNQQAAPSPLEENPHAWFQEAAGAHALVNQTDSRLGVVLGDGQSDLQLGGFVRGNGTMTLLDLGRVLDETEGEPVGYRLLTGIELLNSVDRAVFDRLGPRFRFKDVQAAQAGNSGSNASRLISKGISLGILRKEGLEYVKQQSSSGVSGVDGVAEQPHSTDSMNSTTSPQSDAQKGRAS